MPSSRDPSLEEWKTSAAPPTAAVDNSDARQKAVAAANSVAHSPKAEASSDALKAQESSSFAQASQPAVVGSCVDRWGPFNHHSQHRHATHDQGYNMRHVVDYKDSRVFFRCSEGVLPYATDNLRR
jgi:hypothetical protein